jgi:hypothetical protein
MITKLPTLAYYIEGFFGYQQTLFNCRHLHSVKCDGNMVMNVDPIRIWKEESVTYFTDLSLY